MSKLIEYLSGLPWRDTLYFNPDELDHDLTRYYFWVEENTYDMQYEGRGITETYHKDIIVLSHFYLQTIPLKHRLHVWWRATKYGMRDLGNISIPVHRVLPAILTRSLVLYQPQSVQEVADILHMIISHVELMCQLKPDHVHTYVKDQLDVDLKKIPTAREIFQPCLESVTCYG